MHPEITGDLPDRHPVLAIAGDPHNVVAELLGIGPCHGDILPARPPWASDLRCHLFVQQTLTAQIDSVKAYVAGLPEPVQQEIIVALGRRAFSEPGIASGEAGT